MLLIDKVYVFKTVAELACLYNYTMLDKLKTFFLVLYIYHSSRLLFTLIDDLMCFYETT